MFPSKMPFLNLMTLACAPFSIYAFGFSQLSTKYETTKPPAMRVVSNKVIQNNHHSFYNEGVQAIKIRKNGDYNG